MSSTRPAAIVLAAGAGTRMKSSLPKVLHPLAGRTLLGRALDAVTGVDPEQIAVVVRHERERVAAHVTELLPSAVVADQDEIPGTGRAVQCGLDALPQTPQGTVLVTYGDVPMLTAQTLQDLLAVHEGEDNAVTVITALVDDPTGYGRIIRDADGTVAGIVEHKDATEEQRGIREINSGLYAFDGPMLIQALTQVGQGNAQGEVYLTDVLGIVRGAGFRVAAHVVEDTWQTEGVNDRVQLAAMGRELNSRIVEGHMRAGVCVIDPTTTWIDSTVTLAQDVTLLPGTQLLGATTVDENAVIGPDTTLIDCTVGQGATVVRSHGTGATLRAGCTVGPFSYLRPETDLGEKGKIGAFVETKKATIGTGSKVPHLSYVGDATIGAGVNIGAATVFVNYDGQHKHHTTVEDHARVGSDSMLVAPVRIGAGAYTAAGSVITDDVPAGSIGVGRARQRNIKGWVQRTRPGTPAAEAAARAKDDNDEGATA